MNIIKWMLKFRVNDINSEASHNGFQWKNYFLQKYFMRFAWIVRFFPERENIHRDGCISIFVFVCWAFARVYWKTVDCTVKKCAHIENKNRRFWKERKLDCDVGADDNTVFVSFATCSVIESLSDILFGIVFRLSPTSPTIDCRRGDGGFST